MKRRTSYFNTNTTTLGELQRQQDNAVDAANGFKPLNGSEMRVLEYLAAMDSKIIECGETMRERLKGVPNGWRQWRLLAATLNNLLIALYKQIPLKNLRHMQQICAYGEVLIRIRPPVHTPEYTLIREDDLKTVMRVAIEQECSMCLKSGKEIAGCSLRKAMWNIAPPMEESQYSCEYNDLAVYMKSDDYLE
ncbi:MAG: hypothetical protein IKK75_13900 [Clostridia bacterium]|nr:hypothetical protein [Clostridia bacterium]